MSGRMDEVGDKQPAIERGSSITDAISAEAPEQPVTSQWAYGAEHGSLSRPDHRHLDPLEGPAKMGIQY